MTGFAQAGRAGRSRWRGEAGLTLIEVMVGVVMLTIVIVALATLFAQTTSSSYADQRLVSRTEILEAQMERVRQVVKQYGFTALALTTAPATATDSPLPLDPTNPDDFVSGTGCSEAWTVEANYNTTTDSFFHGSIADNPESLLINGCTLNGSAITTGQLVPVQYADLTNGAVSSSAPTNGDPYATISTFVTATTQAGCNASLGSCTGDVRRVIIAASLNTVATTFGTSYPDYTTSVFSTPLASNQTNSAKGLKILGFIS